MREPTRFTASFDPEAIADLRHRLASMRWPQQLDHGEADPWDYGVPAKYLRDLCDYWAGGFDWEAARSFFNCYDQYLLPVDDLDIHFVHCRSPHAEATPLLLMHGWPGSIFEFWDVIPRLTQPEAFGGDPADAFHVVCPSLPGYGYSPSANRRGMNPAVIASRHNSLMTNLGYSRYLAQGGDWGALVARRLADLHADQLLGVHYNLVMPTPPPGVADPEAMLPPEERNELQTARARDFSISGYSHEQGTKPQTLGYGLSDSPAGLAAWIAEKFVGWSEDGARYQAGKTRDWLLCNISLYWMTRSIASSVRLYREFFDLVAAGDVARMPCPVPTAITDYPAEIWRSPKSWAAREYNLIRWNRAPHGGHFAALEEPQFFAEELWGFNHLLRAGSGSAPRIT